MGWFRRQMDPEELDRVKAELAQLRDAVDAADQRRRAADDRAPVENERSDDARLEELAAKLAALDARPPADPRLDDLASRLAELDDRVTSVSTELANQLSELGSDIDKLAHAGNGDAPSAAVLVELRDGQVRLANEQARYQIAFREDLARVAEQLRRP
jgi:predicted transcriptional regulator